MKSKRGGSETAASMAAKQREISVSEFFLKNRHLLGFDNPRRALLTTVKEAVDNALDACEEAGILPEIAVDIIQTAENRFRVEVTDNGVGVDGDVDPAEGGLGLSIVGSLVTEELGGSITIAPAESDGHRPGDEGADPASGLSGTTARVWVEVPDPVNVVGGDDSTQELPVIAPED